MLLTAGLGSAHGLVLLAHLILRSYASRFGEGALSALVYAFRIYEVPITLAANTAGAILLPALSAAFAVGDHGRIGALWRKAFFWGLIVLLPAVVVAEVEADGIVDMLLRRGHFSLQDVALTAASLRGFAPVILFEACFVVLYRLFYSIHRPQIPIVLSIAIIISLILFLECTGGTLGILGLAASLSGSFGIVALGALLVVRHLFGSQSIPSLRGLAAPSGVAVIGAVIWAVIKVQLASDSIFVTIFGVMGFCGWYLAGLTLGLPEQRAALRKLAQRLTAG
jgi:putative peptidoglycan lipid II flippase